MPPVFYEVKAEEDKRYISTGNSEEIVSAVTKMEMKEGDVVAIFLGEKTGRMWSVSYQAFPLMDSWITSWKT